MVKLDNCYEQICSFDNFWQAWILFRRGKRQRPAVRNFERQIDLRLAEIKHNLETGLYRHGSYRSFIVHDPKRRVINAPAIRDQVVHQAVWNVVFPFFDRHFSSSAFSCRPGRGTHAAVAKIRRAAKRLGAEKTFVLYFDIVKFFDSVSHEFLIGRLEEWVVCPKTIGLLKEIISSYQTGLSSQQSPNSKLGIPLGNLTSQLFCNIALMPFDRLVGQCCLGQNYVRYADDCFIFSRSAHDLLNLRAICQKELRRLGFDTRSRIIRYQGFEALGRRFFADGVALRRDTRRRALQKAASQAKEYEREMISAWQLESSLGSLVSLCLPYPDRRWATAISQTVLSADA